MIRVTSGWMTWIVIGLTVSLMIVGLSMITLSTSYLTSVAGTWVNMSFKALSAARLEITWKVPVDVVSLRFSKASEVTIEAVEPTGGIVVLVVVFSTWTGMLVVAGRGVPVTAELLTKKKLTFDIETRSLTFGS